VSERVLDNIKARQHRQKEEVQSPESRVQSPESRVQSPESRPEVDNAKPGQVLLVKARQGKAGRQATQGRAGRGSRVSEI